MAGIVDGDKIQAWSEQDEGSVWAPPLNTEEGSERSPFLFDEAINSKIAVWKPALQGSNVACITLGCGCGAVLVCGAVSRGGMLRCGVEKSDVVWCSDVMVGVKEAAII